MALAVKSFWFRPIVKFIKAGFTIWLRNLPTIFIIGYGIKLPVNIFRGIFGLIGTPYFYIS